MKYYFLSYAWNELTKKRQFIHSATIQDIHPLLWIVEQTKQWPEEFYELISWQEIDKATFEAVEGRM
jgi:hypothetical protein